MPTLPRGYRAPEAPSGPPSLLPSSLPGLASWGTRESAVSPVWRSPQPRVVYGNRAEHTPVRTTSDHAP